MKNFLKLAAALLLVTAFSTNSNAQFRGSAGADVGYVLNEGMGLTYGLALGGEYLVGDNIGITFHTGFSLVGHDGDGTVSLLPLQPGFKYYFTDNESGLYAHAQVGLTRFTFSFMGMSVSETKLSFAPGIGFLVNEHIDLGARFHMVTASEGGESLKWIALRAAYNF